MSKNLIRIIAILIAIAFILTSVAVIVRANELSHPAPHLQNYIGDSRTHKFHYSGCRNVAKISHHHIIGFASRESAINAKYASCELCKP